MCHDYKAPGRDEYAWETSVKEQRENNIHINKTVSRDEFIAMREGRDAQLGMPRDLNGDGAIDSENHAKDYLLLPVCIRIEWRGLTGDREYELHTVLLNK